MEVLARLEPTARLEDRLHDLARRARVGRRLEHDDVAALQDLADRVRGALDVAQVGLTLRRQRRRQGDQDRLRLPQLLVVGRRRDPARLDVGREPFRGHVLDVAVAVVEGFHQLGDDVDDEHAPARIGKCLRQRDADVTGSHDSDVIGERAPARLLGHGRQAYRAAALRSPACPSP